MPTYEYMCQSCGQHVEMYQRFHDEPLTVCPVCGGELRKVFHPAGILFKGSGFYKTDSRSSKSAGGQKDSGRKEPAKTGGGSDSSSSSATPSSTSSSTDTSRTKPSSEGPKPKERSA